MSVQIKDSIAHVLPGDTMYPKEVNLLEKQVVDKSDITIDEFHKITPVKNRTTFSDNMINIIFTDNASGEDTLVTFPLPGYSKVVYGNQETKNKL